MTRDEIIRMAREAGFPTTSYLSGRHDIAGQSVARFARFAALVAAAEREACAKVCEEIADDLSAQHNVAPTALLCAEELRTRGQQ